MKKDLNQLALTAAGILNIFGTLLFSKFFTNTEITNADPFAMQPFSLFMLMVWGLAMISVAKSYTKTPYLIAVFAIEKSIYAIIWLRWISQNEVTKVFQEDFLAGMFFMSYGPIDFFFAIFFSILFLKLIKK